MGPHSATVRNRAPHFLAFTLRMMFGLLSILERFLAVIAVESEVVDHIHDVPVWFVAWGVLCSAVGARVLLF